MTTEPDDFLPAEMHIALAHTQPIVRGALRIFFELDHRLARIVAATTEPMLGQMRLAWWRDMLAKSAEDRPAGDAVLDGIGQHWAGREAELSTLVDAWEHMLAPAPMGEDDAGAFASGRCAALLAAYPPEKGAQGDRSAMEAAAWVWSFADMASKVSLEEERALMIKLGLAKEPSRSRLKSGGRGLAVLGALGSRALKNGGRPMMEGRGASLIAARAAIFGK